MLCRPRCCNTYGFPKCLHCVLDWYLETMGHVRWNDMVGRAVQRQDTVYCLLLLLLLASVDRPGKNKVKVNVVDLYSASTRSISKVLGYRTHCQRITQFYLHTLRFIRKRNEPYLPLPSQPQLVLIYRPRRDGRLSRPWCEVAQAEIRTRNLPTAGLPHRH